MCAARMKCRLLVEAVCESGQGVSYWSEGADLSASHSQGRGGLSSRCLGWQWWVSWKPASVGEMVWVRGRALAAAAGLCCGSQPMCWVGGGTSVFPRPVVHVCSLANFRLDHVVGQGPVWLVWGSGIWAGLEREARAGTWGTCECTCEPGECQACACTSDFLPLSLARVPRRGNQFWDPVTIHPCQILSKDMVFLVWAMVLCTFGI